MQLYFKASLKEILYDIPQKVQNYIFFLQVLKIFYIKISISYLIDTCSKQARHNQAELLK